MNDGPPQRQDSPKQNDSLRHELVGLFQYIQRVRKEIAAIGRPADKDHKFESMGEQLDAIVGATEEATNTIMEAMERNGELLSS
jgi:chemotaxis protein CheZ